LFDHALRYPTTRVSCQHLEKLDLGKFNVLILPEGDYSHAPGFNKQLAERLRLWVNDGGTLVLVASAAVWASQEKIGLWKLQRVANPDAQPVADKPASPGEEEAAEDESSELRWPDSVPGAFLRTDVFQQHWLTFGCPVSLNVFFYGNIFFEPLAIEDGRNLITFAQQDPLVAAGFCWPKTAQVLPGKTWLAYKPVGKGHMVAFATDPNYRAMYPGLQRLFLNACLFGPGQ
jgi:ribosomal protein S18 acetylase RimI-like enzyme